MHWPERCVARHGRAASLRSADYFTDYQCISELPVITHITRQIWRHCSGIRRHGLLRSSNQNLSTQAFVKLYFAVKTFSVSASTA
jgi:hypothetical protein